MTSRERFGSTTISAVLSEQDMDVVWSADFGSKSTMLCDKSGDTSLELPYCHIEGQ
jgi:hypothetical protein